MLLIIYSLLLWAYFLHIYTLGRLKQIVMLKLKVKLFFMCLAINSFIVLSSKNRASLVAQLVKNLPEMWETWVWSLGWEDPLEKGNGYPLYYSGLENSVPWTTVHGILQARILEWVAFPFSRGSSQPMDRTQVSCIAGRFFTSWATKEAQEYWSG